MSTPLPTKGDELDALDFELPKAPEVPRKRVAVWAVVGVLGLAALFVVGLLPKLRRQALASADAAARAGPLKVTTVRPKSAPGQHALSLPGSVQALHETPIYPRASGYVQRYLVDIGDRVRAGQLLAEIDTPELDHELEQAQATLGQRDAAVVQAKANLELAQAQQARYAALAPSGFATQQELEQRQAQARVEAANVLAAEAAVKAQRASVNRLAQLKKFARVTAPFAGLVTMRWAERGMLVTGGTANRLFTLAVTDPVRVWVQVPQGLASGVEAGLLTEVAVRERPGKPFRGVVTRTSGALDATSRTLTVEVQVPNPKGQLLVGMYAQVSMTVPTNGRSVRVPASALLSRAGGVRVAVVGPDSRIKLVAVTVSRDDGAEVEISAGLAGDEDVVANPGARIEEGLQVTVGRS